MRSFVFYTVMAIFALSIQATVPLSIRPDLILVLVCFYSLREGQVRGMAYGALTGLLMDSASGFIIGPNILSKSIAGFFFDLIKQKFFVWNVVLNTLLIGLFSMIDIFLVRISLETFLGISFASWPSWIVEAVIYTSAVGLLAYPILFLRHGEYRLG